MCTCRNMYKYILTLPICDLQSPLISSLSLSSPFLLSSLLPFPIPSPLLPDAVKKIMSFLGMQPCERSDQVDSNKPAHTLLLAGVFRGGHDVLVRARLAQTTQVTMKMTVRSTDMLTGELVAAAVTT